MNDSTFLGTTLVVDEIITDAIRKLNSDDVLPASEMSTLQGMIPKQPTRSTPFYERIPGLMGYRSFTDDFLKSFHDRNRPELESFKENVSSNSDTKDSDPFSGFDKNDQETGFEENFQPAKDLLGEFERDEKRCHDDNLFRYNQAVSFECPSISASPEKLYRKQVPTPNWAKESPMFGSLSFLGEESSVPGGKSTSDETVRISQRLSEGSLDVRNRLPTEPLNYNPGFPYSLGIIVPGIRKVYDLPMLPSDVISLDVESSLDGAKVDFVELRKDSSSCRLLVDIPAGIMGELDIHIEMPPYQNLDLTAVSVPPTFTLPSNLVIPPDHDLEINLGLCFPCKGQFPAELHCSNLISGPIQVSLSSAIRSIPLRLRMKRGDHILKFEVLHQGTVISTFETVVVVRPLRVSMSVRESLNENSLEIKNLEVFPIEVNLHDNLGTLLSYTKNHSLPSGRLLRLTQDSFKMTSHIDQTARFHLEVLKPLKFRLSETCSYSIRSSQALRPTLDRFVWLDSEEKTFTMMDNLTNEPASWHESVLISPCSLLNGLIEVRPHPKDPAKVTLKVTRPQSMRVGRLRFYRKDANGKPINGAFGFRYPLIVPEKPKLQIHSLPVDTISKAYQMPANRKLKVTNTGNHEVFIVTDSENIILSGQSTTEFSVKNSSKFYYGSEVWRQFVKSVLPLNYRNQGMQHEMSAKKFMASFKNETSIKSDKEMLNSIPSDERSIDRLYQLFVTTLNEIRVMDANDTTFFVKEE